jgi:hypothetical protein
VALLTEIVQAVAVVLAIWSVISVLVAIPVAALFRAQARFETRWLRAERRRLWLEAAR